MLAIYKREMRSYFVSPIGYVYLAIFLAVSAFSFSLTTLQSTTTDVKMYFLSLLFLLVVVSPLLTMKMFAEEKKLRTEQLLLTAPVTIISMVTAKFFAAATVFLASLGLSALNFYTFRLFAPDKAQWAIIIGNYIAVFFVGCAFLAIGLFVSSLTENQLAAAVGTTGILLFLLVLGFANAYIDLYVFRYIINWISIFQRYQNFTYGVFDYNAMFYYFSICFVFGYLTVRVYERRRWGN